MPSLLQNYRAWKYPWTATPTDDPVILPYAQNCSGELYAYVSWNGATEVASWRFTKGETQSLVGGSGTGTTTVNKTNFESMADLGPFAPYVLAEALDVNGIVIGTSATNATFVPGDADAGNCNQEACNPGFVYDSSTASSCGGLMDLAHVFNIRPAAPAVTNVQPTFQGVPAPPS